ncbi:hypothetical protein ACIRSU_14560 [Streptomyces sp. NPDC101160]|uniref:hypothetical protein n=1 Tax=Streptomyces sp. NPDC101160 TaxID=3366118 RepID=UPI0038181ABB
MRGDETQSAGTTRGPRHAAPRKSFLNKIHVPAGKAMALAAMPTAVLVGMGLAPRLALADTNGTDIPFAPGPCVTRSDEPTPDATDTAKPDGTQSPKPTASATATDKPAPDTSASTEPTPGATTAAPTRQPAGTTSAPKTTSAPQPSAPKPTATKSTNPLDPLGLGDALGGLLGLTATSKEAAPAPTATTAAPKPRSSTAPTASTAPTSSTAPKPTPTATAGKTVDKTADDTVDKTKDAIKAAADKAGATTTELADSAKGLDAKKDTDIPDGAKPRFPCPTPDPQALAAADLDEGVPLLPDEPWILQTSKLELRGLKYHGIVEVKTGSGKIKKVLKFTADEVDIWNLHQLTVHSDGLTGHVRSNPGSESTMRHGTVTMYTEELKGNLFGLIPVTFSPQTPPPLDVPWAIFTNCTVKQAGQFGGTLTVPGLRNTIEPS